MATKNFTNKELGCNCGCGSLPADYAQGMIQAVREEYGYPVFIASGARCKAHQDDIYEKMGKEPLKEPPHVAGEWNNFEATAFDIKEATFLNAIQKGSGRDLGEERAHFLNICVKHGFTCFGIGKMNNGTPVFHMDSRPEYAEMRGKGFARLWGY